MSSKNIVLKLKKSTIGCNAKQIATIRGLGFRKIGQTVTLENTSCVRGMVKKMIQWVEIVTE